MCQPASAIGHTHMFLPEPRIVEISQFPFVMKQEEAIMEGNGEPGGG